MERWLGDGSECDDGDSGEPNVAAPGKSGQSGCLRSPRCVTNITMATESTNVWFKRDNLNKKALLASKVKCFVAEVKRMMLTS